MCRYAMVSYKPHYACFNCRKTFKRRLFYDIREGRQSDIAKCPQCGKPMADMGLDFASPSKNDKKAWEHIQKLYQVIPVAAQGLATSRGTEMHYLPILKESRKVMKSSLSFLEVEQNQQVKLKYKGIMTKTFITSVEYLQN